MEELIKVDYWLPKVRELSPLIHNITNVVVTNFTANGLLALGASPVMAYAKEEVADMAKIANALVLNIGTLTAEKVESMIIAGKAANKANVPVLLDPVGAGATPYRTKATHQILNEVKISLLRGNVSEVANVAGMEVEIKGVDAKSTALDHLIVAKEASKHIQTPVVITGTKDIVSDGRVSYQISNGHEMLTKVTGTGCLLSSVIAAFIAVQPEEILLSSAAALATYGIAAEIAVEKSLGKGPGTFQIEFINQLALINQEDIHQKANVIRVGR